MRGRRVLGLAALCLALAGAGLATGLASASPPAASPQTLGPMVTTPWLDDADATPAVVTDGGATYVIVADGSGVWHRWSGSTLDSATELGTSDYSALKAHDEGTSGDDRYWLTDIWAASGVWYGFVHVEYDYTATSGGAAIGHTRRVVLATSTNQGASWTEAGDILTGQPSAPAGAPSDAVDFGDGDQRLVADSSYLYLFYTTGYYRSGETQSSGNLTTWVSVARCPIADVATPGCWTKWSGSGAFGAAGLGGADVTAAASPLPGGLTGASSIPMLTFDQATASFVAMGNGAMSTATDLGAENWTAPAAVTGSLATARCWYLWAYDPNTGSRYTVGQSFRSYGAGGGCGSSTRYQQVELGSAPSQAAQTGQDPWIYQYSTTNDSSSAPVAFSPMTYSAAAGSWQGATQDCTITAANVQQPGPPSVCDAARTWQAPSAMTVTLGSSGPITVGSCATGCGSGVELQIFRDGEQIWPPRGRSWSPTAEPTRSRIRRVSPSRRATGSSSSPRRSARATRGTRPPGTRPSPSRARTLTPTRRARGGICTRRTRTRPPPPSPR